MFLVSCRYFRPSVFETPAFAERKAKVIEMDEIRESRSFSTFDNVRLRLYFFEYEYFAVSAAAT